MYNNVELFGFASSGKVKMWKASTDLSINNDGYIEIIVEWGYVDGKKQTKLRVVKSGKNKGKANETSIQEQALLDLGYLYQKQLDTGYVLEEDLEKLKANPIKTSMLASKFADKQHLLKVDERGTFLESIFIQPKLNGIRCELRREDTVKFVSRTNKPFSSFETIEEQVLNTKLPLNHSFDCELFNTELSFESLSSIINSEDHLLDLDGKELNESNIQAHIYDLMGYDDLSYEDRYKTLVELSEDFGTNLVLVETIQVYNMAEMISKINEWISLGYEGGMVRIGSGLYEYGKRSPYLMKYKIMLQEEFEILDIFLAPQDPSKVMFKLKNNNNVTDDVQYSTFECGIIGNKKDIYNKFYLSKDEYLSKFLTTNFQARSQYGVPLFPVGQYIREGCVNSDGIFIPEV